MPRFFFDVFDGEKTTSDREGIDMDDIAGIPDLAVDALARRRSRELAGKQGCNLRRHGSWPGRRSDLQGSAVAVHRMALIPGYAQCFGAVTLFPASSTLNLSRRTRPRTPIGRRDCSGYMVDDW